MIIVMVTDSEQRPFDFFPTFLLGSAARSCSTARCTSGVSWATMPPAAMPSAPRGPRGWNAWLKQYLGLNLGLIGVILWWKHVKTVDGNLRNLTILVVCYSFFLPHASFKPWQKFQEHRGNPRFVKNCYRVFGRKLVLQSHSGFIPVWIRRMGYHTLALEKRERETLDDIGTGLRGKM